MLQNEKNRASRFLTGKMSCRCKNSVSNIVESLSSQTYRMVSPYIESETFMSYADCVYAIVPELPPALKKFAATS